MNSDWQSKYSIQSLPYDMPILNIPYRMKPRCLNVVVEKVPKKMIIRPLNLVSVINAAIGITSCNLES